MNNIVGDSDFTGVRLLRQKCATTQRDGNDTHTPTVYLELMHWKSIKELMGNEVGVAYNERSENAAIGWKVKAMATRRGTYQGGLPEDVCTMTQSFQNLGSVFGSYCQTVLGYAETWLPWYSAMSLVVCVPTLGWLLPDEQRAQEMIL